jgi:GR25 family glycosyltransferase involved in LPS biosynthesis
LGIDRGWNRWVVFEDDIVASEGAREQIELALKKLNKSRPSWNMLLLGGAALGGFKAPLTNNSSAFLGHNLAQAECVVQAHAYVVSSSCAEFLVRKLDEGFGADSATTAYQRSVWSSGEGGAYWLANSPISQNEKVSAATWTLCQHVFEYFPIVVFERRC